MAINQIFTAGFHVLWQHSVLSHLAALSLKNQIPSWLIVGDMGPAVWQPGIEVRTWLKQTTHPDYFKPHLDCLYRHTPQYPGIISVWRQMLHTHSSIMYCEQNPSALADIKHQYTDDAQLEFFPGHSIELLEELATHHHHSPMQILYTAYWDNQTPWQTALPFLQQLAKQPQPFCAAISYSIDSDFVEPMYRAIRKSQFGRVLVTHSIHENPKVPQAGLMIIQPPLHYEKILRGAAKAYLDLLHLKDDLADIEIFYLIQNQTPDTIVSEVIISDKLLEQTEAMIAEGHRQFAKVGQRIPETQASQGNEPGMGLKEHPLLGDLPEGVSPKLSNVATNNTYSEQQAEQREQELTLTMQQQLQNKLAAGKGFTPPTLKR